MRYVPSTRGGSLLLASLHATARQGGVDPDLAQGVLDRATRFVEDYEAGASPSFKDVDDQMSKLFLDMARYYDQGDGKAAARCADQLDELAKENPFTYAEPKAIIGNYEAPLWKARSDGDLAFGRNLSGGDAA